MSTTATARVYRPTPRNLRILAKVLSNGGLVAVPTETVYGLAADALNPKACVAIFKAKGRPANDPLIVHINTISQAEKIAQLNEAARKVSMAFWPGPLTLVLPKQPCVPDIVTSGLDSVAIRIPAHPLFRELIRQSNRPLAAPSANLFGYVSPTTAAHVREGLGNRIYHILDGGSAKIGVESTILDLRNPKYPSILRPGAISREELQGVLGTHVAAYRHPTSPQIAAPAPGMLERHYSPHTTLTLTKKITSACIKRTPLNEALLFIYKPKLQITQENIFWLSDHEEDIETAAHNLFDRLRTIDSGGWQHIHAEFARTGCALSVAINDRLTRAAAKR